MKLLNKIEHFIFESNPKNFIAIIFGIMLFKTGVWYIPNLSASLEIARNPFINPFTNPEAHYLLWSWLSPAVAWAIGATNKATFFIFHFTFSIAFSFLFLKLVFSRFSDQIARTSFVLFSILPVSSTAYFWVGTDSLTLFLMLVALTYPRHFFITFLTGIALGMQHFEQSFFAIGGIFFATFLSSRRGEKSIYSLFFCATLFIGVVIGKIILYQLFKYYSFDINSGRLYWLSLHVALLLNQFFFHFYSIVWSVLGLGWLIALKYADLGQKTIPFFLTLLGLCILLPISGDQTRVLCIITFPLVAIYWLLNEQFLTGISKKEVSAIFLIWVLVPWSWVWGGATKWSVFPYDLAYLLHRLFGWFNVPIDPSCWPF